MALSMVIGWVLPNDPAGTDDAAQSLTGHKEYHGFMNPLSGDQEQRLPPTTPRWDFLTNHAHVLLCVAHDPGIRLRDIAAAVGITERATHRILSQLVEEGYVLRERQGRRNRYQVVAGLPMRHPLVEGREVGELLEVLIGSRTGEPAKMTLEV
jgi:DNA-binding transcriptional ArsR family regulator